MSKDPIIAQPGNSALRKEVGEDFRVGSHINQGSIDSLKNIIGEAGEAFFADAEEDMAALEQLANIPVGEKFDSEALVIHTYNIRCLTQVLGFPLITQVCTHLISVIDDKYLSTKKRHLLIQKLVEALRMTFEQRIRDDGGEVGQALLQSLRNHL